jgi:hypothetical protein
MHKVIQTPKYALLTYASIDQVVDESDVWNPSSNAHLQYYIDRYVLLPSIISVALNTSMIMKHGVPKSQLAIPHLNPFLRLSYLLFG